MAVLSHVWLLTPLSPTHSLLLLAPIKPTHQSRQPLWGAPTALRPLSHSSVVAAGSEQHPPGTALRARQAARPNRWASSLAATHPPPPFQLLSPGRPTSRATWRNPTSLCRVVSPTPDCIGSRCGERGTQDGVGPSSGPHTSHPATLTRAVRAPTNTANNWQSTGSRPAASPLLERSVPSTFTQGRTWARGFPTMRRAMLGHRGVPKT